MMKSVLFANAASCAIFGFIFVVFSGGVSAFIGSPPRSLIVVLGAGLLANAALLIVEARRPHPRAAKVRSFAIGDGVWVLFSLGLILTGTWVTTDAGIIWTLGVALFVGACGAAQFVLAGHLPDEDIAALMSAETEQYKSKPNRVKKWVFVGVGAVFAALILLLVGAYSFQTLRNSQAVNAMTLPGNIVTTSHGELYVNCQGDPARPTIFFENGMGLASENWGWVQRDLSKDYHACAYDRAGIGFSGSATGDVDAGSSADALAELLGALQITEPVVLVGHSYGGLIARVFADRYPARTAGLVLVDSSHEDMGDRFPEEAQKGFDKMLNGFGVLQLLNQFGGTRMMGLTETFAGGLDAEARGRSNYLYESVSHMAGTADEAEQWGTSAQLAREVAKRGLSDLPMRVLMVTGWPEVMLPSWTEMQKELAELSSEGSFVAVDGFDHFGILTRHEGANHVIRAVRDIVSAAF